MCKRNVRTQGEGGGDWGLWAHGGWAVQNSTELKPHWRKDLRLARAPATPPSHAGPPPKFPTCQVPFLEPIPLHPSTDQALLNEELTFQGTF